MLVVADRPSAPALDVGVVLFDPGVDAQDDSPTAAVRRLESKLLAGQLRDALVASNQWGVVRMVRRDVSAWSRSISVAKLCSPTVEI